MSKPILVKLAFFIVGVVVGGGVVFGVIKLTENSSSSGSTTSNSTGSRANSTLKYVIAISRHGSRGTSHNYPLDPYPWNNTDYWPYGAGQITTYGRTQEYNLGVKLRSMYNGFLSTTYSLDEVYASSDLYDRTMMSGELVLAGLYPPEGWQVWNQNVDWQPIPLFTNSTDHTGVIDFCARYKEIYAVTYAEFLEADAANISEIISYVYNQTGQTLTNALNITYMFEKLSAEETEGYTLPDWTKGLYPSPLNDYYGKEIISSCAATDEMTRLWMGNFLTELVDTLTSVVNGSLTTRSLSYYSAHDISILNIQVGLGIPRPSVITDVHTGSAIVLELHQSSDSSQFYVQVLYIDGASLESDPQILTLPDCGDPCYFDSFLNCTERFVNVDYESECQVNDTSRPDISLPSDKIHVLK